MFLKRLSVFFLSLTMLLSLACDSVRTTETEITIDEAVQLIESGTVTKAKASPAQIVFESKDGKRRVTQCGSDSIRELLIKKITDQNISGGSIELTEDAAGYRWIYLWILNGLQIVILLFTVVVPVLLFLILKELRKRNDIERP